MVGPAVSRPTRGLKNAEGKLPASKRMTAETGDGEFAFVRSGIRWDGRTKFAAAVGATR